MDPPATEPRKATRATTTKEGYGAKRAGTFRTQQDLDRPVPLLLRLPLSGFGCEYVKGARPFGSVTEDEQILDKDSQVILEEDSKDEPILQEDPEQAVMQSLPSQITLSLSAFDTRHPTTTRHPASRSTNNEGILNNKPISAAAETSPTPDSSQGSTANFGFRKNMIWDGLFMVVAAAVAAAAVVVLVAVLVIQGSNKSDSEEALPPVVSIIPTQAPAGAKESVEQPVGSIVNNDSEIKLVASDGAANDAFGFSVAMDGDTIVTGAWWGDTENGIDCGSAYVYIQNGSGWTEQAKLTAGDGALGDWFGRSVAINGDTIVIGVHSDDDRGDRSGSAYVYNRLGATWTEQAKLTASDGAALDNFGWSVAIMGDTIVIGAPFSDTENGIDSGSAYVYSMSWSLWTGQAKLTASDGAAHDWFGNNVAVDGDTIIIGAPFSDTDNGVDSGSAYVYARTGTAWTEQAKLTAIDGAAGDQFGVNVAIDGSTIVIGADLDDTENDIRTASAYVYFRSATGWTEQARLTSSDGAAYDESGTSVAMEGDTIVIGAQNGAFTGSAYVYTPSGTEWTEHAKVIASDGAEGDQFGKSVAISGGTIVIGAYLDDTESGENVGSIYIFDL